MDRSRSISSTEFQTVFREILEEAASQLSPHFKFRKTAVDALHESSEAFLISFFEGKHWVIGMAVIWV
jgi:histone H3/H4